MEKIKVLIIDDVEEICLFIKSALKKYNINTEFSHTAEDALKKLGQNNHFDLILLDYRLPDMNGFELLEKIQRLNLTDVPLVILMTGYEDVDMGMKSIQKGCYDYLAKPFNDKNLVFRVKRAIENRLMNQKIEILSQSFKSNFKDIIGNSIEMQKIYKIINQVANKDTTILLEGETGTGKELVARAIHQESMEKNNRFIPINCGALTESLLESELFGYEKGAFTGATTLKYGILDAAHGGTVFLDEINNASLNVQIKLLRFIEEGEFMRVGGNKIIHCETRIIVATNQNIESMVEEGKFREDLYHRLNIVKIVLPPLREKKSDIPILINHFLNIFNKKFGKKIKIYKTTENCLAQYYWPGNVRQLKNLIHSLILLNETGVIEPVDLPEKITNESVLFDNYLTFKESKNKIVSDFEIKYLNRILKETGGNVSKAAKASDLSRSMFIEKLKLYNINTSK